MWWIACATPDPELARLEWLRAEVTTADRIWMSRDPERVADKYQRMYEDPYDFMRGTAGVFYADLERPDADRNPTVFLRTLAATNLLVVGDPHPENFGTALPGDDPTRPLSVEVVDLDGAGFGPYTLDLRRAVLGMQVLSLPLAGCGVDCRAEIAGAEAQGYLDELAKPGWDPADPQWGAIVADVRQSAFQDGQDQLRLREMTEKEDGEWRLLRTGVQDGVGTTELTDEEVAQLKRLLKGADFRVLDAVRRYGMGVSSLPALRFLVLADHGSDEVEDDFFLNLREVVDAPALPGFEKPLYDSSADRILESTRAAWRLPDADIFLDARADGGMTFKRTSWSGWFQTFDHRAIEKGWPAEYSKNDLLQFATMLGHALAGVHLRGQAADGSEPAAILQQELAGREAAFVTEVQTNAVTDLSQLMTDYRLFRKAIDCYGPLLGADEIAEDLP